MVSIRSRISAAINHTIVGDIIVRAAEFWNGVRYPVGLIGRRNISFRGNAKSVVLVVAAHPDDEVLGVGNTLARHRSQGDRVIVVFSTNGAGGNWRDAIRDRGQFCATRFSEACEALGVIGIPVEDIGCLGFPDGGLHRYLREAARDLARILRECAPSAVYVHALEGGHSDHDMTSYLVQALCNANGFRNLYEWCEYNMDIPLGSAIGCARFAADPYIASFGRPPSAVAGGEIQAKRMMLEKYASQAGIIRNYPFLDEGLRTANPENLWRRLKYFTEFSAVRLVFLSGLVRGVRKRTP